MTKKSLDDEKRAEREYANFILDQDKIRMELETQAIVRRNEEARRRQAENIELWKAKQKMSSEEAAQQKEYSLTFPFETEVTPKERVTQPYKENDAAMEERRLAKSQVAEREASWAGEGGLMEKILDAEDARKQKMLYRQREYQESLAQQTADWKNGRQKWEKIVCLQSERRFSSLALVNRFLAFALF
jgi:alkanesulfonate monooxygenase SsuD/methylene tetrahydromethanopterin reductase-like flavin-dependent oxidoreductase (luciferase family)